MFYQDWVTYITILNDATCGIVLDNSEEKAIIEILRRAVQRATGVSITSKTKKVSSYAGHYYEVSYGVDFIS